MTELSRRQQPAHVRAGTGYAPGTFGELLQGVLAENDLDFLVTLPIQQGTTAVFQPTERRPGVRVLPAHKHKAARLAELLLSGTDYDGGGVLHIDSDLIEGKGFASSSADLVATARAVGDAFGIELDNQAIEDLLRGIEPTDGVMYDGAVAFYHRAVRLRARLGFLPELAVVAHDEGGQVDTIQFNRLPKPFGADDKVEYGRLLAELGDGVQAGHLPTVGAVATRSALMNARIRRRANFAAVHRACRDVDGFGLVIAHSGTMLGILLDAADLELAAKTQHVRSALRSLRGAVSVHRTRAC
jgi:uncharacterized protein involved in propanediol utilization